MTKEKFQSLTKYANQMKERLASATPTKWAHAPAEYKAFLSRELRLTLVKLDAEKMEAPKVGK